jgi:hypothetical protein
MLLLAPIAQIPSKASKTYGSCYNLARTGSMHLRTLSEEFEGLGGLGSPIRP